nr:ribonuclease H-like domain-containing protein [Tanacetum cinerariifolium]
MAFTSSGSSFNSDSERIKRIKSRSDKGYLVVSPPYTENYIPPKPDLMFIDEQVESKSMNVVSTVSSSAVKTVKSKVESVDDWIFVDESEVEFEPKVEDINVRPSIEKIKFVKTARETKEKVETPKQHKHYPRGNQRNWNNLMSQRLGSNFKMINKACYVYGSFEHLYYVCDQRVVRPVWNNTRMVNHKNFASKMTHPHPKRRFVPQAILTKSGKLKTAESNSLIICTGRPTTEGVIDSGCSRDGKGIISRKGKLKTGTLDFDDVYFYFLGYSLWPLRMKLMLKTFITGIENQLASKVKVIRCENGTEFKNSVMNQFCDMKGIKREFSVARTPQQNGVAERKNRTLIEAIRTMLVDSKLPITFWKEAVNTACYVLLY